YEGGCLSCNDGVIKHEWKVSVTLGNGELLRKEDQHGVCT
ncbi:hypothetical protein LCGC14_2724150, partial [marine sediment metagenome]